MPRAPEGETEGRLRGVGNVLAGLIGHERTGWQASGWMYEGGTSGRRARVAVGVCVCGACLVCECAWEGGELTYLYQDWLQSLPRNMRGPGEDKGRGGEIPPSPVTRGTIECL